MKRGAKSPSILSTLACAPTYMSRFWCAAANRMASATALVGYRHLVAAPKDGHARVVDPRIETAKLRNSGIGDAPHVVLDTNIGPHGNGLAALAANFFG